MNPSPEEVLKKYWGFTDFRGSQKKIIDGLLNKNDVLALMPTGGGKSICFQVPGLVKEGICIVISPLVALIEDQVQVLKQKGIKAIGLTSGVSRGDLDILLDNCIHGNYKFLYLSPERLQQDLVRERIQKMHINLIAIDEAHCISEWGHDFRPAYRQCSIIREIHPNTPTIALTATATEKVADDILSNLNIPGAKRYRDSFERKNIRFSVKKIEDKKYGIEKALQGDEKSAIIYVRSRKDTVAISKYLNRKMIISTFFHGGLTTFEKKERLKAWLNNKVRVMVATNAFGMGVDKPNVGTVIHYQLPESIENYYQEAGRAGRDGNPAKAILMVNPNDVRRAKQQFLDTLPDISFTQKLYKKLNAFFQIAYNEGENEEFYLNLNTFCERYGLQPSKTYTTLKLLDQNGVISLLESSKQIITIHLTAQKQELFKWIEQHTKMGHILQVLLRTYGGLLEFETRISLALLSKKTGETSKYIHQTLQQLEKDGLASYKNTQHDLAITFLKPREDEKTINPIVPNLKQLNKTKGEKLQSMLNYYANTSICRTSVLLEYFGEKNPLPCGKCDVCTKLKGRDGPTPTIKKDIVHLLSSGAKTSREIIKLINYNEEHVLRSIKELLEDGQLKLNLDNTYDIK